MNPSISVSKVALPVSKKAYAAFRERIFRVGKATGIGADRMAEALDRYLEGRRDAFDSLAAVTRIAMLMLLPEVDAAIARSRRARERARLRRQRREEQAACDAGCSCQGDTGVPSGDTSVPESAKPAPRSAASQPVTVKRRRHRDVGSRCRIVDELMNGSGTSGEPRGA